MTSREETAPWHLVELGDEAFDPKDVAKKARRRTTAGRKRLAEALGVEADAIPGAEREPYLVQLEAEPDADTAQRLRRQHGFSLAYGVSGLAFLERLARDAVPSLRRDGAVRACVAYWPELKCHPGTQRARRVEIGLVDGDDVDAVLAMLDTLGVGVLRVNDDRDVGGSLSLLAEPEPGVHLLTVAAIDDVAWIAPVGQITLDNLGVAGVAQHGTSANHPIWDRGLHGENIVIGVIDAGEIDLLSQFFRDSGNAVAGAGHRKVLENRTAAGVNVSPSPRHPILVSGSAVADDEANAGGHANRGGAWAAKMTYGDIFRVLGVSPSASLTEEFQAATEAGARVHTNSWGLVAGGPAPAYDSTAADIDAFLWRRQDLFCAKSTSNPGSGLQGGLVVAKNPLVVGGVRAPPNHNTRQADPLPLTADGRRKPDLLGVSENITTSTLTNGGANPLAVATVDGNSFTTPHVAGAAALVRQYFIEGWYPDGKKEAKNRVTPSGTLLKATLLNATVPLAGVTAYPSARDGWGRLQLNRTLHFDGDNLVLKVWDMRHPVGLDADGRRRHLGFEVPTNATRLRITLVFADPAHEPTAIDPSVNKLDLEVLEPPHPSKFGYFGNDFQGLTSRRRDFMAAGLTFPPDPAELKNNVRQVAVNKPVAGRWWITVKAHRVDQTMTPATFPSPFLRRRQGYAVVACAERS